MDLNELKRRYSNKDNEELLYALKNPENYEKETIIIVKQVIQERGGREKIEKEIIHQDAKISETEQIRLFIYEQLENGNQEDIIRQEIHTDYLTTEELENLFQDAKATWEENREDRKITFQSLVGGLIGGVVGGTIGGILWRFMMIWSGKVFLLFAVGLVLLCYFFVWLFSRKSKKNIATILITAVSVFYALFLGQILFEIYGI